MFNPFVHTSIHGSYFMIRLWISMDRIHNSIDFPTQTYISEFLFQEKNELRLNLLPWALGNQFLDVKDPFFEDKVYSFLNFDFHYQATCFNRKYDMENLKIRKFSLI